MQIVLKQSANSIMPPSQSKFYLQLSKNSQQTKTDYASVSATQGPPENSLKDNKKGMYHKSSI